MQLVKTVYADYNDNLIPLSYANIFESDALGNIISGGYYFESNNNGEFIIDTDYVFDYITFSWQGQKKTLTYQSVINASVITIAINLNELDEVVITTDKNNNALWFVLIGLLGLKILNN